VLDPRGVTLFDALQAFFQEHQYCGDLDGGVPALFATWVRSVGGRSVEPGAEPDEPYEEERTTETEQNGACDDHIPKYCPTLEAEQASPHGEREHTTSSSMRRRLTRLICFTRYDKPSWRDAARTYLTKPKTATPIVNSRKSERAILNSNLILMSGHKPSLTPLDV
jgi:hypothetical protein